ncbi:hypothetical protein NPIL_444201 [Nephila pilipes]|uniref:Uncharacterized protein n=1 Tax=Nephila pilipes TaxID=299642 RepID=A0A8X6TWY9_NEPPI|nr:hypothetical protein NPIL_444201 [Nephila pilipes]
MNLTIWATVGWCWPLWPWGPRRERERLLRTQHFGIFPVFYMLIKDCLLSIRLLLNRSAPAGRSLDEIEAWEKGYGMKLSTQAAGSSVVLAVNLETVGDLRVSKVIRISDGM